MSIRSLLLLSTVLPLGIALAPAQAQEVGRAGAVNPAASSAAPGAAQRTLNIGARLVFKERIVTTGAGSVQLVFLDKTTLNVGPNSELLIDEFVYDPRTETGRMTATVTRGVLRFVGGAASHTGGATVRTPVATIGIRGGVATISHQPSVGTRAVNHFGRLTVNSATGTEVIRRPGFAVNVAPVQTAGGSGGQVSAPTRVTQGEVVATNQRLTSSGAQSGGAPRRPTDTAALAAGVGRANAPVAPSAPVVQAQTTSQPVRQAALSPAIDANSQFATIAQSTAQGQQQQAAVQTAPPAQQTPPPAAAPPPAAVTPPPAARPPEVTPPPPAVVTPPPVEPGVRRAYALEGANDPALGNPYLPFLRGDFMGANASFANTRSSLVLGFGAGGLTPSGTRNNNSRVLQAGLTIAGVGSGQSSTLLVMTAPVLDGSNASFNNFVGADGGFVASTRRSSTNRTAYASGAVTSLPGTTTFDPDFSPLTTTVDTSNTSDAGVRLNQSARQFGDLPQPPLNYSFTQTAAAVTTPAGLGSNRPTAVLLGFTGGTVQTRNFTAPNVGTNLGPSFRFLGNVAILLDDTTSNVGGAIGVDAFGGTINDTFSSGEFQFGYLGEGTRRGRGTYVDFDNFGARETRAQESNAPQPYPSTVNNQPLSFNRTAFVTAKTVEAASLLPGVTVCNCAYSQWGFWSTATQRPGVAVNTTDEDRIHLAPWVAGRIVSPAEIPATGSATYAGHAIGSFRAGTNEYVAAGNFSSNVNFGTRTGSFSISNLDGRSYAGSVAVPASTAFITGTGSTISGPTATIGLQGAFFGNPNGTVTAGAPPEMGGNISIQGTNYIGAGIFQAGTASP
jgi:hypothetical protein